MTAPQKLFPVFAPVILHFFYIMAEAVKTNRKSVRVVVE
ncbi:MAG: hypothetical protein RHS_2432 [Robinsoniella sp. RHS]|nr:MAG: hypothetical protein RHS_2432 [Robinsoniella sp. RHS]